MRSTERFTGLATIYGQARPTYPQELVRWCLEQAPSPGYRGPGLRHRHLHPPVRHHRPPGDRHRPQRGYVGHDTRGQSTSIGADRTPYLLSNHSISFHATRTQFMCIQF